MIGPRPSRRKGTPLARRVILAAAALAAAAAAGSGCGATPESASSADGGESRAPAQTSAAPATIPLTPDQYIAAAGRLCREADSRIEAIQAPATLRDNAAYMQEFAPTVEAWADGLKALEPPPGARLLHETMLARAVLVAREGRELGDAAARGDAHRVKLQAKQIERLARGIDRAARSYGLRDCGL